MTLDEILHEYCANKDLAIHPSVIDHLDYIITDGIENIGIMIKDWNRSLGFNVVIYAEQIKKRYRELSEVMILTNVVSDPAKSLAEKIGIPIFKHWQLLHQTKIR